MQIFSRKKCFLINALLKIVINDCQVYRSYRGDVTLLTDIVRCAVQFETPADLLRFVKEWIFLYGEPQTRDPPKSMLSRWGEELQEFMLVVTNSSILIINLPTNKAICKVNIVERFLKFCEFATGWTPSWKQFRVATAILPSK